MVNEFSHAGFFGIGDQTLYHRIRISCVYRRLYNIICSRVLRVQAAKEEVHSMDEPAANQDDQSRIVIIYCMAFFALNVSRMPSSSGWKSVKPASVKYLSNSSG